MWRRFCQSLRLLASGYSDKVCEIWGYTEGTNILVDFRYAEGKPNRSLTLVAELVQFNVDILVAEGLTATRAAKELTKKIPVITVSSADLVAAGIVNSLARPGGNITGLTRLTRDLSGKRLELFKETVPGMSRRSPFGDGSHIRIGSRGF